MNSVSRKVIDWLYKIRAARWQYSRTYRMKDGYADCSSAVFRAYRDGAGITLKDGAKTVSTSCYQPYADCFDIIWPPDPKRIGKSMPRIETLLPVLNLQGGEHIFMNTDSGTDRANMITHVVTVLEGATHIIHMRNPQKDVTIDPISYCNKVCAVVRYNGEEDKTETVVSRLLKLTKKPFMRGSDVGFVQARLAAEKFYLSDIDGFFGPKTDKAVRAFQKKRGLTVDGVVGPQTTKALGLVWKG